MNVIKYLTNSLAEVASENMELERKYATVQETAHLWYQNYEAKDTECKELTAKLKEAKAESDHWLEQYEKSQTELTEATDKLKAAEETVAKLEAYIKTHEEGAQNNE